VLWQRRNQRKQTRRPLYAPSPADAFAAITAITKLTGLFGAALDAVIAISSLAQI